MRLGNSENLQAGARTQTGWSAACSTTIRCERREASPGVQAWARTSRELPCPLGRLASPGNPSYAPPEDVVPAGQGSPARIRPSCSCCVQPDSEAREAEAELGLGRHIWPALMADIGGTRYVTRGETLPFPQRAPPVRESVRVGGGKCRLPAGNKRGDQRKLIILDVRTDSCVSAWRCILVAWDGFCPWSGDTDTAARQEGDCC